MKNINILQFETLLKTAVIRTDSEMSEEIHSECADEPDTVWGWIWNELVVDGLKINYQNSYEHPVNKPSLATTSSDVPDIWTIEKQDFAVARDGLFTGCS